jgi:hypothetical protein
MAGFIKKHIFSLSIIFSLSVWSLWPILKDPARNTGDIWDGVLMAWYLNQTIQKIPGNPGEIFQGNIFYPYKNTMAYSDMHILSAFVSYLPVKITGEPIVAVSSSLLFGQAATMLVLYLWFYEITKSKTASFLASVCLGLSATRISFLVHLQMWNMEWFLLSSFLFYKFVKSKKHIFAYLSFLFLGLQMWNSPLGVYFGALLIFLISLFNLRLIRKNLRTLCISFLIFLVIIALPAKAYLSVSKEFNYIRTIRDAAHFSMGLDRMIKEVFLKPIFIVFIFSLYYLQKRAKRSGELFWALSIVLSGLVLTSGPVLKWAGKTVKILNIIPIPLPYSVLYYLVPGFKAFRTPDRWIWIAVLGMSFVIAIAIAKFLKDSKIALGWKVLVITIIIVVSLMDAKVKNYYVFQKISEYPKVYSILKDQPPGVLLELPVYGWASGTIASIETHRMVYSLYHNKYLLGGSSGFNPPFWDELIGRSWNEFPSVEFESKLKSLGVRYILLWKDLCGDDKKRQVEEWEKDSVVYEDNEYILFDIRK